MIMCEAWGLTTTCRLILTWQHAGALLPHHSCRAEKIHISSFHHDVSVYPTRNKSSAARRRFTYQLSTWLPVLACDAPDLLRDASGCVAALWRLCKPSVQNRSG